MHWLTPSELAIFQRYFGFWLQLLDTAREEMTRGSALGRHTSVARINWPENACCRLSQAEDAFPFDDALEGAADEEEKLEQV